MTELQAGVELDTFIAEKLMGWLRIRYSDPFALFKEQGGVITNSGPMIFPDNGGTIPSSWRPSSRLDHAVQVAEKLREDGWLVIMKWMPAEFYFHLGGGFTSEYDHRPQPEPENVLKGKTVVDLDWMRGKDSWLRFVPAPRIISADTPALAICKAAVEAVNALEELKRRKAERGLEE